VVAAAVGGLLDTVVDGVTGVHVPPRDPAAAGRALAALLADPSQRRRLGVNAARRARRYDWDRIAAAAERSYLAAAGARGRRTRREVAG
jgi:glycosyltransferase involved in cell wall biosynthesis